MKQLMVEDMIKAIKCIASQDDYWDCYMEHENFNHMEDDNYKPIVCGTGENLRDQLAGKILLFFHIIIKHLSNALTMWICLG